MIFKKYIKESVEAPKKLILDEGFDNPDAPSEFTKIVDDTYMPITILIEKGEYAEALQEIEAFEAEIANIEAENSKKKFFKFPQFMLNSNKRKLAELRSMIPTVTESIEDMDKRCEKCNTLLNDGGTCPKCDDGEEDYGDEIKEELTNKEKLLRAYPELNFDMPDPELSEDVKTEALSNREKLLRAFPELNFDTPVSSINEGSCKEELSVRDKLKAAYPELNFDNEVNEEIMPDPQEDELDSWYDDEYDIEDDVEEDRRHAALYGGDRMYCDCGAKLSHDEYGAYCPNCDPHDPEYVYESYYDDTCDYVAKECSYDISYEIAMRAKSELKLPAHEVEMLEHDINNLRSNEWVDTFANLPDKSKAKKLFFQHAVECVTD